jgi:hypothetical protein
LYDEGDVDCFNPIAMAWLEAVPDLGIRGPRDLIREDALISWRFNIDLGQNPAVLTNNRAGLAF